MSEFARGCWSLALLNLVQAAIWLWGFGSDAGRCAVLAATIGVNIGMITRLCTIWRRERGRAPWGLLRWGLALAVADVVLVVMLVWYVDSGMAQCGAFAAVVALTLTYGFDLVAHRQRRRTRVEPT